MSKEKLSQKRSATAYLRYIREVIKIRLLEHREVVRLAQQIEKGESLIYEALLQFSFVRGHLLEMIRALRQGEIQPETFFDPFVFFDAKNDRGGIKGQQKFLIRKAREIEQLCLTASQLKKRNKVAKKLVKIGLKTTLIDLLVNEVEVQAQELKTKLARLTRAEQRKKISPGTLQAWLESQVNDSGLSVQSFLKFADQISQGQKLHDQAARQLIESNLRFVVKATRKHYGNHLEPADLIQEGNFGLMRAVQKFDFRKGYRFSTYAAWWIHRAITRAIYSQDRLIKLPVAWGERLRKITLAAEGLSQRLGHEPSLAEIARELKQPLQSIEEILEIAEEPISLEQPISKGDGKNSDLIRDLIPAPETADPARLALLRLLEKEFEIILKSGVLEPKEAKAVKLYFGHDQSLKATGKHLNLSATGAQNLLRRSLAKLRQSADCQRLLFYRAMMSNN